MCRIGQDGAGWMLGLASWMGLSACAFANVGLTGFCSARIIRALDYSLLSGGSDGLHR